MDSFLYLLLLGVLEGLTEFIPVSSTGHLILLGSFLNLEGEKVKTFEIVIQLGAILAVVVLYPRRFLSLWPFGNRTVERESFSGFSGLVVLGLACAPALVAGAVLHGVIKGQLFAPRPVAWALIVGGIALSLIERLAPAPAVQELDRVGFKRAFIVGLFQCLALWPGFSRSGATIIGGLLCGMNRRVAAEFSFLVAVPVMCAATGYDLLKSWSHLGPEDILPFAFGFLVSFVVAVVAIRGFLFILQRFSLAAFGVYRIALGIVVLWVLG